MFQCSTNFYSKADDADVSPMALVDHKVCMKHPACSMTSCKRESTVLSMVMAPFWQAKTCGAAVQQSFHSMEKMRNSKQLHSLPNSPPNAYTYLIYFTQRTQSVGNTKVQCVFAVFFWAQVKCMHATFCGSNAACWKTEISLVCQHGKQTWWGLQWGSCNLEFGPVFGSCSHSGTMVLQLNSIGVAASRICFAESLYTHCCCDSFSKVGKLHFRHSIKVLILSTACTISLSS